MTPNPATCPESGPAPIGYCGSGMMAVSEDLAMRRRRLRFRCWHRGMKEVDLLLGRFADARLERLGEDDLAAFEALLDTPDQDILGWIVNGEPVPEGRRSLLLSQLLAFHGS
jgi:antitoxin CptB